MEVAAIEQWLRREDISYFFSIILSFSLPLCLYLYLSLFFFRLKLIFRGQDDLLALINRSSRGPANDCVFDVRQFLDQPKRDQYQQMTYIKDETTYTYSYTYSPLFLTPLYTFKYARLDRYCWLFISDLIID